MDICGSIKEKTHSLQIHNSSYKVFPQPLKGAGVRHGVTALFSINTPHASYCNCDSTKKANSAYCKYSLDLVAVSITG